jgi:molybdopterin biosynthesis enzyme
MPAQLLFDPSDGAPTAIPIEMRGSADVVAGGQCDGVIVLPEARTYKAGSVVEFHLWSPMA